MHRQRSCLNAMRGIILLLLTSQSWVAWAEEPVLKTKEHLQAVLKHALPGLNVMRMSEEEVVPGWMQLDVETEKGQKVVYVDLTARYVLVGSIFDLNTGHNLTRERLSQLREKIFDAFDSSMAIMVKPTSSGILTTSVQRPILYFTDPDCPFCQRFQPELQKIIDAGYPVAVLLFPSAKLHPDAPRKAASIWCAEDRIVALEAAFREEAIADPDVSCPVPPLNEIRQLAHTFGITGTPSLVLPGGEVIRGFQPAEGILTWLARRTRSEPATGSLTVSDKGRNTR